MFAKLCNNHHYVIWKYFITRKRNPLPTSEYPPFPLLPGSWPLLICFPSLQSFPPRKLSVNGVTQCVGLCDRLLSLNIMFSRSIHVGARIRTSFFLCLNNIPSHKSTMLCLLTHWLVDIWAVSAFWLLCVMLLIDSFLHWIFLDCDVLSFIWTYFSFPHWVLCYNSCFKVLIE